MNITKSTLLSFSPTGTTSTVLASIGKGLGVPAHVLDMTLPHTRTQAVELAASDVLIIGFPVYAGRLPDMHTRIFALLPQGKYLAVPVVVYGNREYDDALLELTDVCLAKGYTIAGAAAFIGQHSFSDELATGRPNVQDQALAEQFGVELAARLAQNRTLQPSVIPGNRPYKDVQKILAQIPVPVADAQACTKCMVCVRTCPAGAIASDDPLCIDATLCIRCASCVSKCSTHARNLLPAMKANMRHMAQENANPKLPALFLPDAL